MPNTAKGSLYNSSVFYSPNVLRTYVIALLDMVNHIKVRRYESDYITIKKEIDVPVKYGLVEKEHMERKEDATSEGGDRYYQSVPRMALLLSGLSYATDRVKSNNEERELTGYEHKDDPNSFYQDYEPTPYDFQFELQIRTESTEDFQQIIEQILPYFNPDRQLRVKELPFLNIERDIQVLVDSTSLEFSTEMSTSDSRQLNVSLSFTLKGYLYRPITSIYILKELYKYFAYIDNGVTHQDRRIRTLMEIDINDIPEGAENIRSINNGEYYLYELIDNVLQES